MAMSIYAMIISFKAMKDSKKVIKDIEEGRL